MVKITVLVLATSLFVACKENSALTEASTLDEKGYYQEVYRPQFHFTPEENWMNDPNGLVYHEGIYHLFYQYYPGDIVWGPMHWGHAVSEDMVHWQHKPIALYPDERGHIFSGSAVVDTNNSSGFGKDGQIPLVAIFTYHAMDGEKAGRKDFQTQGIAYSLDNGESWTKFVGNPVIGNSDIKDFRDPKVFWHDESESWIMALVAGDHVKFYRSKNLKEWDIISDFGEDQGAHGGVWECPDLFPLKVEGTDEEKWVLIISIGSGGPNGGSGTQYFIGDFDGTTFTSDQQEYRWLDWGADNYAGVTYNNTPNGERIFIGWMSNWQYAVLTPTKAWRSGMTLPRKLSLKKYGDSYMLVSYPLAEVDALAQKGEPKNIILETGKKEELVFNGLNQSMISFKASKPNFDIVFSNEVGERFVVTFDALSKLVIANRTRSGLVDFQVDFGNKLHFMDIKQLPEGDFEVKFYIDRSSVELFVNKGQFVLTEQLFPTQNYMKLSIQNIGEDPLEISDFSVSKMNSIW